MKSNSLLSLTTNEERMLIETLARFGMTATLARHLIDQRNSDCAQASIESLIRTSGYVTDDTEVLGAVGEPNYFGSKKVVDAIASGPGDDARGLAVGCSTAFRYIPFCPFSKDSLSYWGERNYVLFLMPNLTVKQIVEIFPNFFSKYSGEIGGMHESFRNVESEQGWHFLSRHPRTKNGDLSLERQLNVVLNESRIASVAETVFMMILLVAGKQEKLAEVFGNKPFGCCLETRLKQGISFNDRFSVSVIDSKIEISPKLFPEAGVIISMTPLV
jgi:hypothetical protein